MANRSQKITLLNDRGIMGDNNPRLPDPSKIDSGQLAINYSKSKETLAIKNDNDEIVDNTPVYPKQLMNLELEKAYLGFLLNNLRVYMRLLKPRAKDYLEKV